MSSCLLSEEYKPVIKLPPLMIDLTEVAKNVALTVKKEKENDFDPCSIMMYSFDEECPHMFVAKGIMFLLTSVQIKIRPRFNVVYEAGDRTYERESSKLVIYANGDKYYYKNGERYRDYDLPAIINANGAKAWYKNGKCHRDHDLPAIVNATGDKFWYKNGKRHRNGNLPAVVNVNGDKIWYKNGERHRDGDLPAIIYADGRREWWKHGEEYYPS